MNNFSAERPPVILTQSRVVDGILNLFRSSRSRFLRRVCREIIGLILSDARWEDLTRKWYQRNHFHDPVYLSDDLFDWELRALAEFPSAPANILVLAAGKGRELRALQRIGYMVFGMELDGESLSQGARTCDSGRLLGISEASFFQLAEESVLLPEIPVHGIIIGWGGFLHVPSERTLRRLFRRLKTKYPGAPILLSWPPIEAERRAIGLYRKIRSHIPFFGSRLQQSLHPLLGPISLVTYQTIIPIFEGLGFSIVLRGSKEEYQHIVIR